MAAHWIAQRLTALCLALAALPLAAADETAVSKLTTAALEHRLRLAHEGGHFSGPGFDRLVQEASQSRFFLLGEEHGIAENPPLAAALFVALQPAGYRQLVIEISPPMADTIDQRLRDGGLSALAELYAQPGGEPAFFGMQEEAQMLATVRAAVDGPAPVLWGVDYEVGADRQLLRELLALPRPDSAQAPLAALQAASEASWARFAAERSPQHFFSFSGDPELIASLRAAWPDPEPKAAAILHSLEETLRINQLWVSGQGWRSNERRGALMRNNFLQHWQRALAAGEAPRVMFKLGGSHLVRGRNMTDTFDLGALLPELAAIRGERSFSLLVLPGVESQVARLDPVAWVYQPAPAKDGYDTALEPLLAAAWPDAFTLIDLRPLRGLAGSGSPESLRRVLIGFDALLVMNGSTPAADFGAPAQAAE